MKTLLISAIASISILTACNNNQPSSGASATDTATVLKAGVIYTCPMHPEVISDKPGKCPKCKMDLVEKKEGSADTGNHEGHSH
jgi:hypothetical protein